MNHIEEALRQIAKDLQKLQLIEARGYQRGRVLLEELDRVVESKNAKGG